MSKECSLSLPQSCNGDDGDSHFVEDRTTKKVRFKVGLDEASADMVVDPDLPSAHSWKDKLLGGDPIPSVIDPIASSFGRDSEGPWIIFGQYLTVQPWTKNFSPLKLYPSVVLAWIRLPRLLGFLFRQQILEAIRGLIGKVIKLDFQTDNRTRGRFARLAMFINLEKPLVSQVLVDGAIQRVEYEALPIVCFGCGKYGHVKHICPIVVEDRSSKRLIEVVNVDSISVTGGAIEGAGPEFGP
ncbi:hypothetical protein CXB51_014595 [Gossypium anomalum]|uniref:CCHC-type domain-containing protein n=1 Tax=Gossypium anomalum TaxID=47600 RepID=A0A8J5YK64_9ROSI|nr:hypothetical protein CXB51_014595 [Gossypium anomalum]